MITPKGVIKRCYCLFLFIVHCFIKFIQIFTRARTCADIARAFVHYRTIYRSIQQFHGHDEIGRNIGLVGEERKKEFHSFLFITGGKGREEILDVP